MIRKKNHPDLKPFILVVLVVLTLTLVLSSNFILADQKDGSSKTAIRGVWLTNVASDALFSAENIEKAVKKCADLGFNTIFMVTWNGGYTLYPSEVAEKMLGEKIDPEFKGRDPLKELINAAHQHNIKVFAWYEFGFATAHRDSTGGKIIQKYPDWASRDIEGNITEKNDFQWMNPFHHEVQNFMISLIAEAVEKYDLDGIQGDDRLPALPSNGGYDEYTTKLYQKEHNNDLPPKNAKDYEWVKWRSAKLTLFLKDLVTEIKSINPDIIISMAPSIYPWSEENYLQDWPTWLNMGLVELVVPQVYRYNFPAYKKEMDKIYNEQVHPQNHFRVIPGVLLQVDKYNPDEEFLEKMIAYNKEKGSLGEVHFFYEGIKKFEDFFKRQYAGNTTFPELIKN